MTTVTLKVHGIDRLQKKLTPQLAAGPMSRFMRKCGFAIQERAMTNTRPNVFDGGVINGFVVDVAAGPIPGYVRVANTMEHAIYLEEGTAPHFPPVEAIAKWAELHGFEPYALALHIAKFGTQPHPFMVPALLDSKGTIIRFLAVAANEIEAAAAMGAA